MILKKNGKKFWFVVILILLIDQISKILFKNVHFGIFNYVTNTGAAFGILKNANIFLIIIGFIVLFLVLYFYLKYKEYYLPFAFIFAGTLGNLIDRLSLGFVRDFIDFKVWPVFNVADSFNVIGVCLLILILIKKK